MALPININELISGRTVEWERIEFKEGWNPLDVIQTICAFANDFNNWGGGYIIIGIKEKNGLPVLPPKGIKIGEFDKIQKEMVDLCHQLRPEYFPIAEPVEFKKKQILVIWVPGGQVRPYKAPDSLGKGMKGYSYYIRHFSSTKKATDQESRDLVRMSAQVPYDDQVNQNAEITDLSLTLIQNHLATIGSDLHSQVTEMPFPELCRKMNIVSGPDESLKPKNIGLMIFNTNPTKYFPCARIDVIQFKDDEGDSFSEKYFEGPIQQQLQDALLYIKNNIVAEKVVKVKGRAESIRTFNYPFEAIEEAIANTVYHRSYEDDSPIEIRIFPSYIEMISYPGPLPPLTREKLLSGENIVARKYRNRRIGDFLKELRLTEGRGTGIPKIRKSMQKNGSPDPVFDTDEQLSYFSVKLKIHPSWRVQDKGQDKGQVEGQVAEQLERAILEYCLRPKKKKEILGMLGLANKHESFVRRTKRLFNNGFLESTIPEKLSSSNQQYRTTRKGEIFLRQEEEIHTIPEQGKLNL